MNEDGTGIRQVSFNQSHDYDPMVMSDGKILFSRWDNAGNVNGIHLYRMNPDGSELELLYGANSHFTGTDGGEIHFVQPREMPDGQVMALVRPFTGTDAGGDVVIIDVPNYLENTQPTMDNQGVLSGPAQVAATVNIIRTDLAPSRGGRYGSAFPLWDGTDRVLVAWNQCRLLDPVDPTIIIPCDDENILDPNAQEAPPLYGIWMYDRNDDTQVPVVAPEEGVIVTEVVAAQPRPTPQVIVDGAPGVDLDADLALQNVGLLNIRSVYDIDGVEIAPIAALADPAVTVAADRPARFLRLVKPVPLPDDEVRDFDNSAFGRSAQQGMRDILGYAPIQPDGSVMMKVPANVPFAVSVVDENGRRITPRHQNWMQVQPGDTLTCNGCHDPASGLSHGRADSFASVYDGAQDTGQPFPNTDPALFADFGETMAEALTRVTCATDCSGIDTRVDIFYDDIWTDETAAGRLRDVSFSYRYADLDATVAPPTSAACMNSWEPNCRITINYETNIHPLWAVNRQVLDPNDPNIIVQDNTCTTCHGTVDSMNNPQVPAAQLNLEDGLSPDEADHFNSYRELLFNDNAQVLDNGALIDQLVVVGTDPVTGDPITQTVNVAPSMNVAGANLSNPFFSRFDAGGTHTFVDPNDGQTKSYLNGGELKLVAEWLDIGGQYYNNPFDAPEN